MDYLEVTHLDQLAGGIVKDLFPEVWEDLLENVADENTPAGAKRSITITVDCVPTKDREAMDISIKVVPKLAPSKTSESRVLLSNDGRKTTAHTRKDEPKQPSLGDITEFPANAGGSN